MKEKSQKPITTIGRMEEVSFPDLGLVDIAAKIDTGAYSVALHCHDIIIAEENGKAILSFKLLDPSHPEYNEKVHKFDDFIKKSIKNSFGSIEERYIIKTKIKIGSRIVKTSISLSDRASMRFPVLIGRKLLRNRFVVDVNETYLMKH